jgi:CHAT domain-containing protein/Tfp pilus assembly protein PilF
MRNFIRIGTALLILITFARPQTSSHADSAPRSANEPALLQPGKPLERELRGGETHTYKIHVEAGQFLHIAVLQKGIDVDVTLRDPSGKEILKVHSLNGSYGPNPASAIASISGDFQLEIAAEDVPPGRYEVQVTELGAPAPSDRTRMKAEQVYREGRDLFSQGDAKSYKAAAEKYQESLTLWQTLDDEYGEAVSLDHIGRAFDALQEHEKAIGSYRQALPLWRALADRDGEAGTLNNIGVAYLAVGEGQKALDHFTQALPAYRAAGDRPGEAVVLNDIGVVYESLGEGQKALDYFLQGLPVFRATGDRSGEAKVLVDIGAVYDDLGEKQKALDYYAQALTLSRITHDRDVEGIILSNMGQVYDDLGEKQKALDYYAQTLSLCRALGDRDGEAATLNNIGRDYFDLGQEQKALEYYAQALPVFRAVGNRAAEAVALSNIGKVHASLGEKQKALDYFNQALPLHRAVGERYHEAVTLTYRGKVYASLGDKEKALEDYGLALSLFRAVRDPLGEARVLLSLMTYWKEQNRPGLAIFFGKQAIDRFQEVRRNIKGLPKEEQQSFLKSNEGYYRDLAGLLIQEGRLPEAQEVLDLLKLEEYAEFSHRRAGADSPFQPVARTRSEQTAQKAGDPLQADLAALGNQWLELKDKPSRTLEEQTQYDQLTQKIDAANQRWQKYLDGLYADFGKGDQANRTVTSIKEASSGLRNLLRGMNPGTVALYTLVLDQKCVLVVITPQVTVAREAPVSKAALRGKVFAFVGGLAGHQPEQDFLPKAQDLYRILIAPVEKDLEQAHAHTLLWSLDDVLRYVPLAALHDGQHYLVERFANVVITTTSLANFTPPQVAAWRGVAMGVSKDYDGLGKLAAVPGELNAVVTSAAMKGSHGPVPGAIMLDDAFTEKNLEAVLDQPPPLIHMATHFVFNPGDDERSFLLLGGKDEGGQGYHLSLADLRNESRLNNFVGVELLTLSGCETGMGSKDSDGREVDSLGIVGQLNGAKSVVATLWKVDDVSVGSLMETFYRLWITPPGMAKSEALRQAQLTLLHGAANERSASALHRAGQIAQYSNPYYWAPFVLMGNWK